ncbi:hypothetical protein GCM10009118_25340 [Wandonia haliotis]|uniref:YggT family protein n=1 Tax=Wandonia haliotis TaxID=574963 RepID=A0ABN1MTB2_9FLAO
MGRDFSLELYLKTLSLLILYGYTLIYIIRFALGILLEKRRILKLIYAITPKVLVIDLTLILISIIINHIYNMVSFLKVFNQIVGFSLAIIICFLVYINVWFTVSSGNTLGAISTFPVTIEHSVMSVS